MQNFGQTHGHISYVHLYRIIFLHKQISLTRLHLSTVDIFSNQNGSYDLSIEVALKCCPICTQIFKIKQTTGVLATTYTKCWAQPSISQLIVGGHTHTHAHDQREQRGRQGRDLPEQQMPLSHMMLHLSYKHNNYRLTSNKCIVSHDAHQQHMLWGYILTRTPLIHTCMTHVHMCYILTQRLATTIHLGRKVHLVAGVQGAPFFQLKNIFYTSKISEKKYTQTYMCSVYVQNFHEHICSYVMYTKKTNT